MADLVVWEGVSWEVDETGARIIVEAIDWEVDENEVLIVEVALKADVIFAIAATSSNVVLFVIPDSWGTTSGFVTQLNPI